MNEDQDEPTQNGRQTETGTAPGLSNDLLYRALADTRRRRLLYVLLVEGKSTVDEIATVLAGWDATQTGTMALPADREQIIIELDHVHLPRLVEAGLVTHVRESGVVETEPLDDAVADLICRGVESAPPSRS